MIASLVEHAGENQVEYIDPVFPTRPLMLYSARPRHYDANTPILFSIHGRSRNGRDYRDYWRDLVDETGMLVISPEFSMASYPGASWFQHGNLVDETGQLDRTRPCTFPIIERLFGALRSQGVTGRRRYGLFGHSAGSQYVHRMISLGHAASVAAAVPANGGTFLMPDLDVKYPYGLGDLGLGIDDLRKLLSFRLTVMAGTADVDVANPYFPKDPVSMQQGATRYERGHRYIKEARAAAAALGMHCAWTIIDVPDVAHEGDRMAQAAAHLLAAALHASEA